MFAIVQAEKFKLLCVVTDIKAKVNIDFVHDVGLNLTNFSEVFKIPFSSNEVRHDQYRWN